MRIIVLLTVLSTLGLVNAQTSTIAAGSEPTLNLRMNMQEI